MEEIMSEAFISAPVWLWGAICGSANETGSAPVLGNVLVAGAAGLVTLFCFIVALRMLIAPGERNPNHPKYRILSPDR
jgi:hypothetical protein